MNASLYEALKIREAQFAGKAVQLIPLQVDHVDELWRVGNDPQIWQWLGHRMQSREDMQHFVKDALAHREQGTEFPFVVMDCATGDLIGSTRYMDIQLQYRNGEIGWTWYNPRFWRTRVNTECKYMLLRHAFEKLNFVRVQLKTDVRNIQSQEAIERLGAAKEGVLRHHRIQWDGHLRTSVYYSILAGEWPAVKTKLEGWLNSSKSAKR
jgi:N-acetyltransferase